MELDTNTQPWKQQPGEVASSFALFQLWLELDPLVRSIERLAEIDPRHRDVTTLHTLRSNNKWVPRTAAYEEYLGEQREERNRDLKRAEDKIHLQLAQAMVAKCLAAIEIIQPERIGPQYLPRIVDSATKLSQSITRPKSNQKGDESPVQSFEQTVAELNKEIAKA
jgi:hypothetical protein